MRRLFFQIWHDPVWSKVISAVIIAGIALVGTAVSNRYDWLQDDANISRLTLIVLLLLLIPANLVWIARLINAWKQQDQEQRENSDTVRNATPEIGESLSSDADGVSDQGFEPDAREIDILQLLFNESDSTPVSTIMSKFLIQNRQEAIYHLERLRGARLIRGPLKYPRSGTANGYAILQAGREFIMKNGLILR